MMQTNTRKLSLKFILLLSSCFVSEWVLPANLDNILVSPQPVSIRATVTAEGSLTTAGGRVELVNPRLRLQPSTVGVTWTAVCVPNTATLDPAISTQGAFLIDGAVIATVGTNLSSAPVACELTSPTIPEQIVIPAVVQNIVLDRILEVANRTQSINQLVNTGVLRLNVAIPVQYQRVFTHDGGSPTMRTGTLNLQIGGTLTAELDVTQLESVTANVQGGSFVTLGRTNSTTNIDWRVNVRVAGRGSPINVTSSNYQLLTPDGRVLRSVSSPLSRRFPAAVTNASFSFNESIVIPSSVAFAARQQGANQVVLSRRFTDGTRTVEARTAFLLAGAASAGFQIFREDLYFSDLSRTKVVGTGDLLYAVAVLNYTGTGQLQAIWEWATLPPGGQPLFRPLTPPSSQNYGQSLAQIAGECSRISGRATKPLVREFLTGFQRATLCSPPLPTDAEQSIVVRLRIDDPSVAFQPTSIRYFVGQRPSGSIELATQAINVLQPAAGGVLTPEQRFAWQASGSVEAYQVEFYANPDGSGTPFAGMVVPGDQTVIPLSKVSAAHLAAGAVYWRVIGLRDGEVVASSSLRKLNVPAR